VAEAAWGIKPPDREHGQRGTGARHRAAGRNRDAAAVRLGGNGPRTGGVAGAIGYPVLVAPGGGVLSDPGHALGRCSIDMVSDSRHLPLEEVQVGRAEELFGRLERDGIEVLTAYGLAVHEITHESTVEMRFVGQGRRRSRCPRAVGSGLAGPIAGQLSSDSTRGRVRHGRAGGVGTEVLLAGQLPRASDRGAGCTSATIPAPGAEADRPPEA